MHRLITAAALGTAMVLGTGFTQINAYANPPIRLSDQHEHKEGEKHEHKKGEKHEEDEGPRQELGTAEVSGFKLNVSQVGDVKPGENALFIVKVSGGTGEPKAVRAWVGIESGKGSIKASAEEEKEGEWHAHFQVSKPLPKESKLWVEVETESGKKRTSFAYKA